MYLNQDLTLTPINVKLGMAQNWVTFQYNAGFSFYEALRIMSITVLLKWSAKYIYKQIQRLHFSLDQWGWLCQWTGCAFLV